MPDKQEILINVTPQETRVAVVEEGIVEELHLERIVGRSIVGNIYKGQVVRVLPGMQAAFVDIGLQKNGFLHARDIVGSRPGLASVEIQDPQAKPTIQPIEGLVHPGQNVWVQVRKDPISDKGARLSTELSIPSRNLVYLPAGVEFSVSQKIESRATRSRLRSVLKNLVDVHGINGGFIIRTQAETATDDEISDDLSFIKQLWSQISDAMKTAKTTDLLHQDLSLLLRTIRDVTAANLLRIRIDSKEAADEATLFAGQFVPDVVNKIEYYGNSESIFKLFSIEQEISRALKAQVMLISGGDLVIDQTQAMTTIDVNTGSNVGGKDNHKTILRTNLEAASEIAHQLRLRNSGGIIIIDFIDMTSIEHQQQVLSMLEIGLARDRMNTSVGEISPLGLVEVTRKRTRESLEQLMCERCEVCEGRGTIKTTQTMCYEILREILKQDSKFKAREYTVIATSKVIDQLQDQEADSLVKLQQFIERPIKLQVDPLFSQQEYDIALG